MIFYPPTNSDLYSPKESSLKNSPRGPIGRVLSLPCIICWKNFSPRRSVKNIFLCGWGGVRRFGGGVGWCGAYLPLKFFRCLKISFQNIFFQMCLTINRNGFNSFPVPTGQYESLYIENGTKNRHFWPSWHPWFGYFGGRKSRFLDFFKVVLESLRKFLRIV